MSCYIKQAISPSQETAFYIGKTRQNPITQRGEPMNKSVSNFINENGQVSWRVLLVIPDHELHSEYGESYLVNCFKDKLAHLPLLNVIKPHALALGYDKRSESFIDKLVKLFV